MAWTTGKGCCGKVIGLEFIKWRLITRIFHFVYGFETTKKFFLEIFFIQN
jgi:hypothetical protein